MNAIAVFFIRPVSGEDRNEGVRQSGGVLVSKLIEPELVIDYLEADYFALVA